MIPPALDVTLQPYETLMSTLDGPGKCQSMIKLLDTLPNVMEMKTFLLSNRKADLKGWVERVSPSALSILRWIIASNRACIVQVDGLDEFPSKKKSDKEERVHGMQDWLQFRFAMGAPDKEQSFQKAVQETATRLKLKYPTLFAWHGSQLPNWHSIIRQGLHFQHISHGRAYGNGVYHALQCATSLGYSSSAQYNFGSSGVPPNWPSSLLHVNNALALSEIVNAPDEFVSRSPHLVIDKLHWIQTRYLFVQGSGARQLLGDTSTDRKPTIPHVQDPRMTPVNRSGERLIIPAAAIKQRKKGGRPETQSRMQSPPKKMKFSGTQSDPITFDEGEGGAESESSDAEDTAIISGRGKFASEKTVAKGNGFPKSTYFRSLYALVSH